MAVRALMREREEARKQNDYETSDRIRSQLNEMGVKVIDQKGGPSGWRFLDGSSNKLPPKDSALEKVSSLGKRKADSTNNEKDASSSSSAPRESKKSTKTKVTAVILNDVERSRKMLDTVQAQFKSNNGVIIEDLVVGTGKTAQSGNKLKVFYVGKLKSNNHVFDSSTKKPFTFRLGRSEVIQGWDIGCVGMKEGGKRVLQIPADKAYGRKGAPPAIPPNRFEIFVFIFSFNMILNSIFSALIFEITLLQVL